MNSRTQYSGPERRVAQRRQIPDRRELIRFETDKEPRRQGNGRRKGDFSDRWTREGF
ncbi:MAG: hypothetical protein ABW098_08055 [Candidatus Thiodiazotropha sp.]